MEETVIPQGVTLATGSEDTTLFLTGTIIFIVTYLAIALEKRLKINKTVTALFGSSLMLFLVLESPSLTPGESTRANDAYSTFVDFNVIFLLAGMMIIVNILRETGVFQYLAIKSAKIGKGHPLIVLALLLTVTAMLSAFLDNVTTVLLIAPVSLLVAEQLKVNPLLFLIPETLASNIGGTATLIGDPPNILIGSYARLNFMDFLFALTPFVIVFMVIFIGALMILLRGVMEVTAVERARIMELNERRAIKDRGLLIKCGVVILTTLTGFIFHGYFQVEPGVVAMGGAAMLLMITRANIEKALEEVEWPTLFFFLGLFIVVNGAVEVGLIARLSKIALALLGENPYIAVLAVLWCSGLAAGIMNNVSFTAAALPIVGRFISDLGLQGEAATAMWWALALGACLGGNLTPVGSAANLMTLSIAEKSGHPISFASFLRWGIPCSLGSLILASFYVTYLVWAGQ